jgi:selenocysteine lyase/cysteine desulfurase
MYAPYGVGVLVGNRETFDKALPDCVGGGTVKKVTFDDVVWADAPERLEAGTPTVIGCVAVAAAAKLLQKIGWEDIIQHEKKLTEHALKRLSKIPEVTIYGGKDWDVLDNRLGVITFNVDGLSHKLVAAILNYEGAIGVRNGLFCAHPYTLKLLGVAAGSVAETGGCTSRKTGAVRASFGIYNTCEEIDTFCDMLQIIADMEYDGDYKLDTTTGAFIPRNFEIDFEEYFDF